MRRPHIRDILVGAAAHTATGLLFAILMSLVILILPSIPFLGTPLVVINHLGTGLGMGVFADQFGGRRRELPSGLREPRLVFLDLSQEACDTFYDRRHEHGRCRAGHPAQPELVFETLKAISGGSPAPAVIIVDAALIDRQNAPHWPGSEVAALPPDGPPIIYGMAGRRLSSGMRLWLAREPDPDLLRLIPRRRLIIAAARTFSIPGAISEGYPSIVEAKPIEGGPQFIVPAVPYAAAFAVAKPEPSLRSFADALLEGQAMPCEPDQTSAGGEELQPRVCADAPGGKITNDVRMTLYSVRSLAYEVDTVTASRPVLTSYDENKSDAAYVRIRLGANISDGSPIDPFPSWPMAGAVVVIGTSAASAEDVHATPIGPMAGPEVLLNAVRSSLRFETVEPPGWLARSEHKIKLIFITTLVYSLAWLTIGAVIAETDKSRLIDRAGMRMAVVSIFGLAFLMSIALMMIFEVYHSAAEIEHGEYPPDILTPVIAFSLEGFAEGAAWFFASIHKITEEIIGKTIERFSGVE